MHHLTHPHLHDAVDLLCLARQAERVEKHPQRGQQGEVVEVKRVHVLLQDLLAVLVVLPQKLPDLPLVQPRRVPQEMRDIRGSGGVGDQLRLLEVLDAFLRGDVEDAGALLKRLLLQLREPQHLRTDVVGALFLLFVVGGGRRGDEAGIGSAIDALDAVEDDLEGARNRLGVVREDEFRELRMIDT